MAGRDGGGPLVLHVQKVAGISGSEGHLLSVLPRLRERGWDVRFLMLHEHEAGAWEFAGELEARGIPLDAITLRADVDPGAFARVLAHLLRRRPEILHTHLVHADAYGHIAGALANVPVRLATKHGFNEFREGRLFSLGDRFVASLSHRQISISRGLARYLADTEGFALDDFDIVHYGIEPVGDAAPSDGPPRLLCLGRLIPIKGHLVLLRALRAARERVPDVRLEIAGRGPLERSLKAYARELGVGDLVDFVGHVVPPQTAIERATVVVVPSMGEGFGMVALEAMERARPVVAADVGGLSAIVRHGETGLLVPPADPAALADAIVELVADPARAAQLGEAGRRRALEHFTIERCVERTELVYRELLARADGGRSPST